VAQDSAPVEHLARRRRLKAEEQAGHCRLAAAAFADDRDDGRLLVPDHEGEILQRHHLASPEEPAPEHLGDAAKLQERAESVHRAVSGRARPGFHEGILMRRLQ
jgi:hypothetical protein